MIEVEIKARITSFDEVRENFAKLGVWLEGKEIQRDFIFGNEKFLDSEKKVVEGGIIARIRQANNRVFLELKEIKRQDGAIEIKSEITDIALMKSFLEKLGFKEAFVIEKLREIYGYKGFKLCLDEVIGLGRFIEIEKMVNKPEEKAKARQECLDLLKFLAENPVIEDKKYGDLMQELINSKKG